MAFTCGFWTAGLEGTAARMNYCLLGWGLKSEFPTASSANKGMSAYATDEKAEYYSNGSAWVRKEMVSGNLAETIAGTKTFSSIPVLPASDPTTDNQATRKLYVDTKGSIVATELLKNSNDTEKTTASLTYVKVKEILISEPILGTIRIKFDLKSSNYAAYGRIYRNGVAIGTERNQSTTYATFSEDLTITWAVGDLIQIYAHGQSGATAYVKNFEFFYGLYKATTNQDP